MDLAGIERRLNDAADVLLVDPRLIRRIIKQHRGAAGLVPHDRCYQIARADLLRIVSAEEAGLGPRTGRQHVLLVARPSLRDVRRWGAEELFERLLRAAFHARVHMALEALAKSGILDEAAILLRIESIGRTEFEEIRAILTHDDQVLPPAGDLEVYSEFAASYLELREFAPALIVTTFPGLSDRERVDETLAIDLDTEALLRGGERETMRPSLRPPSSQLGPATVRPARAVTAQACERWLRLAEHAFERENQVETVLLAARAEQSEAAEQREKAQALLHAAAHGLRRRLKEALWPAERGDIDSAKQWSELISSLARRTIEDSRLRMSAEAKVLVALERAVLAYEQPGRIVDVPSWILSLGKRPIVRPRSRARELEGAMHLSSAVKWAHRARLPAAVRTDLNRLAALTLQQGEHNVRVALRPSIRAVLEQVGLKARTDPQRLAQDKLVEELLDEMLSQGFLSLPQLRDAISRNELKLRDLSDAAELYRGDALLLADAKLSDALDGIYRRGDIYLRAFQKLSSIPFGTRIGRGMSLYLLLPLLASFTLLEGIRHLMSPLFVAFGSKPLEASSPTSLFLTAILILALVHSEPFRGFARQLLEIIGTLIAWLFFRIPRAILRRPLVKRVLEKPEVRVIMRRIVLPTALAGIVFWATPAEHEKLPLALPVALATFLVSSFVIGSRFGWWFEGYVIEQFAPTWHVLSRQWLPGLFRFISRVFSTMMEGFQRAMYRIDDLLRFRRSRSFGLLVVAAGAGTLWAAAAYVIRFYMTLLVEPEINPLKHFPVVTVAHKILLPFLPDLENAFEAPLSIMGPIVGASIAWVTAFLLPSVFGFLAWELKENYRLYQATRSERIQSARFGPSGETMRSLLVAGIHSGTLPKLYERLRRSAQRREELSGGLLRKAVQAVPAAEDPAYAQFREGLGAIERALYRFVERELLPPIAASRRWIMGYVAVSRIDLSSNRIRIQLSCPAAGPEACDLTLEQLGGRIVAGMAKPGFVTELSKDQALLFENALAVFYHRCEIDLVREQIEAELGGAAQYDVNEDGLCVWPDDSYQTELVYDLDAQRPRSLIPAVQGARLARPARVLDSRRIVFHQQTISWAAWENAWAAANHETEPIPRILLGPSLLSPQRGQDARASAARLQLKSYASLQ